eukprot:CAMPEP_0176346022 /NCGR_PEP_ID=MMETSP0126-20121128/5911_1 /TAXON_ID=141414 ORGANISM="Strombidinopsis acuminatum, Strain SPMC142" /NCGR_SAMPLE_ID=MMETSP0126 /ASSEMBLY_ACC=CAM_ASM_000229 /LENGTH=136 /DNA_ID=CAMNT_0017693321 /DNA_START=654 /DNA_END=1067 /DNA_ORIENTATION=-
MYNRLGVSKYKYNTFDLPIDAKFLEAFIGTILTFILTTDEFLVNHPAGLNQVGGAIAVGMSYMTAYVILGVSYSEGLGGPINSIVCTEEVAYQCIFNAIFYGEVMSSLQISGVVISSVALLLISLGEHYYEQYLLK